MNRLIGIAALAALVAWNGAASAQQVNLYCQTGSGTGPSSWLPWSTTNPCPVSATFAPSGTQNVNVTQILGAAPSLTNPLFVSPATGASFSVGGATSNASSGVATSSTNLPTVSYNYGFNGATWDQLQVDGSKNLKVLESNSAAILTALGSPFQAGGSIGNTSFGISGTLPAFAATPTFNQGAPNGKTTTQAKLTVSVTNTYQQLLASSSTRVGCTIQYVAVAGSKGYVYFGSAPSDTTTSFQLLNGQTINCAVGGTSVATDAVQVTATGTDIFVVTNQ